jgi:hypothetical protein
MGRVVAISGGELDTTHFLNSLSSDLHLILLPKYSSIMDN